MYRIYYNINCTSPCYDLVSFWIIRDCDKKAIGYMCNNIFHTQFSVAPSNLDDIEWQVWKLDEKLYSMGELIQKHPEIIL